MVSSGIRIAGFGGQGVIVAGMVIGKAAAIHDGKFATLTQSFGPEARGSACGAQLIVSDQPILYPYLTQPDILVAMSQEAHERFATDLKPAGMVLYEQDLIHLADTAPGVRYYGIPATRFAEELGQAGAQYGDGRFCHRPHPSRYASRGPQGCCYLRPPRH